MFLLKNLLFKCKISRFFQMCIFLGICILKSWVHLHLYESALSRALSIQIHHVLPKYLILSWKALEMYFSEMVSTRLWHVSPAFRMISVMQRMQDGRECLSNHQGAIKINSHYFYSTFLDGLGTWLTFHAACNIDFCTCPTFCCECCSKRTFSMLFEKRMLL